MPTPREAFTNTVQRQGFSGARVQAADFGAAGEIMGRAAQGLGQQLGQVAEVVDKIQLERDKVAAQDGLNQSSKLVNDRAYKGETGFFNKKNKDAEIDHDVFWSDVKKIDEGVEAELAKRPRALQMYRQSVSSRNMDLSRATSQHASKEYNRYADTVADQGVVGEIEAASLAPTEEMRDQHIATAGNLAVGKMERNGIYDPVTQDLERKRVQGQAIAARVDILESEDPVRASEYLESQRPLMLESQYNEKRLSLAPSARRFQADSLIESRIGGGAPLNGDAPAEEEYYADPLAPKPEGTPDTPKTDAAPVRLREVPLDLAKGRATNSRFGLRTSFRTDNGQMSSKEHKGKDLDYRQGEAVPATMSGTVIKVTQQGGYGNIVEIDHGNGLTTFYAHLSSQKVVEGQVIKKGDIIALAGGAKNTPGAGNSTGAHLHYATRQNGKGFDPDKLNGREMAVLAGGGRGGSPQKASVGQAPAGKIDEVAIRREIDSGGYSPKMEEEMHAALDRAVSKQDRRENNEQRAARDVVAREMLALGPDGYTDYTQLSLGARTNLESLDPAAALVMQQQAVTNRDRIEGKAKSEAGERDDLNIRELFYAAAANDERGLQARRKIMGIDFRTQYPNLSHSDKAGYMDMQHTLSKPPETVKPFNPTSVREAVNRYKGTGDTSDTMQRGYVAVVQQLQQWVRNNPNVEIPQGVMDGIVNRTMLTVTPSVGGKKIHAFQIAETRAKSKKPVHFRADKREVFIAQYQARYGSVPSESEIAAALR